MATFGQARAIRRGASTICTAIYPRRTPLPESSPAESVVAPQTRRTVSRGHGKM